MSQSEVFDPVRNAWVLASPEEIVRQQTIRYLIENKHFPQSVIAVERALSDLVVSSISKKSIPNRRIDILCFAKNKEGLRPLVLIECKAKTLDQKALDQAWGYNHYLSAPYVALVSKDQILFSYKEVDGSKVLLHDFLDYQSCLSSHTK